MKATLIILITLTAALITKHSFAQLKVAQFSYGKYGTDNYEKFEFWTDGGIRAKISYSYGKKMHAVTVQYAGKTKIDGEACFKVRFTNGYLLSIVPKDLMLQITDSARTYNKTFTWEYEGPVNGIGTFCNACAQDDREAIKIVRAAFAAPAR